MHNRKPIYIILVCSLTIIVLTATFLLLTEQRRLVQDNLEAQSRADAAEATAVAALNQRATVESLAQSSLGTIEAERSKFADIEAEAISIAASATADAAAYAAQESLSITQTQEMLAYELALESQVLLNEQPKQFERSVLLAVEAAKRFPTVGTVQAVKDVLNLLPRHEKRISFDHEISAFAYSPNDEYVAVWDYESDTIWIYDVRREHVVSKFTYDGSIKNLNFSLTGNYIIGEDWLNDLIIVWDVVTGTEVFQYTPDNYYISHVAISSNDKYLGVATVEIVELWELVTGEKIASWPIDEGEFAFSADGEALFIVNNGVHRWEIVSGSNESLVNDEIHGEKIIFSPQKNYLFQSEYRFDYKWHHNVWSLLTGDVVSLRQPKSARLEKVVFSSDERFLAAISTEISAANGTFGFDHVQVWDVESGQLVLVFEYEGYDLAFSPDNRYLAVSLSDDTLRVWNTVNWQEVKRIGSDERIMEIAFSSDGNQLIAVQPNWRNDNGQLDVWDINVLQTELHIRHSTQPQPRTLTDVAFFPDNKVVATGGQDGTIHLWNTADGSEVLTLDHGDEVSTIAISPDGQFLLSGGANDPPRSESPPNPIRLWNLNDLNQVFTMTQNAHVSNSSFSPDGVYFLI
ncbi:MAG: hypothetical protein DWQ04_33720, partial [Chloroflexi bacterium]